MEQHVRVPKRGVVDPWQMPEHVVPDPEGKGDSRVGERSNGPETRDRRRECRRDREHDEERRPLGEDDVLQEMHRQQVVHPERVDRRHADGEQQRHRAAEGCDAPRPGRLAPHCSDVCDCHPDDDEALRVPRPRVRIHSATLDARGCSSVGRAPAFQAGCRRFEPGRPLLQNPQPPARTRFELRDREAGNTPVMSDLPKEARALLATAPGDFVDERNRLARRLRDDGRSEEAATVAALRKPPPVVLAANRAARSRPQAAKGAVRAAERAAKRLGSDSDAREELEAQLRLLEDVAIAFLGSDAKPASEDARRRLRDLLRNAVADEETRTALARGVLEAEPDPAGFAAYAGIEPRARKGEPGAGGSKARAGRQGAGRQAARAGPLAGAGGEGHGGRGARQGRDRGGRRGEASARTGGARARVGQGEPRACEPLERVRALATPPSRRRVATDREARRSRGFAATSGASACLR